jgi:dinuclear metal center YbgI/SA1388 family protein
MKIAEIYKILDKISPFELQEKWDNSGIQIGDEGQEINKVVLSIDVDEKLIDSLDENTLLITHHPIIFSGIKSLDSKSYPSNLLMKMVRKNIANIAMHTNFDKTHLNSYVAKEILELNVIEEKDFIIYAKVDTTFAEFVKKIKTSLNIETIHCVASQKELKKVALTTGSGCSLLPNIEADCFLTGDIKYHDAMQAKAQNISLIDIGHFESERYFGEILQKYLKNLGLEVIITSTENPFTYM